MRRIPALLSLFVACPLVLSCRDSGTGGAAAGAESLEVFFSPRGGCTDAVVRELDRAGREILIQAYYFTSAPIAKAVAGARKRGVNVVAVLDKCNRTNKYSAATFLKNQGCDVFIDARHAIAHSKVMIIDEAVIITGSFNFTDNAEESNAENLLIVRNRPELVAKYLANFREHQKHSERYTGVAEAESERGKAETRSQRTRAPETRPARR
jgi:phosphatidylserine/phosphatidylglycerophosphate/cardiolipin synthase-like enzyme